MSLLRSAAFRFLFLSLLLAGLPLVGVWLAGRPIEPYLQFPPVPTVTAHAPFSWAAFLLLAPLPMLFFVLLLLWLRRPVRAAGADTLGTARTFPWWGWLGATLLAASWGVAWGRFPWFAGLRPYTFTPLWVGYILVINALAYRRTGRSLMTDRALYFLALFPLSALFWWYFEYLNRFVQNWHYLGVEPFGPWNYFITASLAFSTVLPTVASTWNWLASLPGLGSDRAEFMPLRLRYKQRLAWLVLWVAAAGLAGIGIWPQYLFPLLWLSPLLILIALQTLAGERTIFSEVRRGDWRPVFLPAIAALVCGFFWEMWNYASLAHWEYSIPFVDRFELFELPLLGYAGYLPFGLECLVVVDQIARFREAGLTSFKRSWGVRSHWTDN